MNEKSSHQPALGSQPNFCAVCAHPIPTLTSKQRLLHRFCANCEAPIHWGDHEWLPIALDDAGTVVHAEEGPQGDFGCLTIKERFDSLLQNPGKVLAAGAGAFAIGGGLIFTAAPLLALGAVVGAAGVAIVQTTVVGGVAMAIIASKVDDEKTIGLILKCLGAVAVAGLATVAAGGILAFLAALLPLLGTILITAGALATVTVVGHQVYLRQQRLELERAVLANTGATDCTENLPCDTAGDVGQLLSDFLNHHSPDSQANPKLKSDPERS